VSKHPLKYSDKQFLKAIDGSGGVRWNVMRRLGCNRHTFERRLITSPAVRAAWEEECERIVDEAEAVVKTNIKLAREVQEATNLVVDSVDSRWILDRLGKARGYTTRQEVTGEDGGEVIVRVIGGLNPGDV